MESESAIESESASKSLYISSVREMCRSATKNKNKRRRNACQLVCLLSWRANQMAAEVLELNLYSSLACIFEERKNATCHS